MLKKIFVFLCVFILLITVLACAGIGYYIYSLNPVSDNPDSATTIKLQVPSGKSVKSIAQDLYKSGIIRSQYAFYLAARNSNVMIKAGTYYLSSNLSVYQIFEHLQTGKQEYLSVSIPEGLTISKIARILSEKDVVSEYEFIKAASNPALLQEYNIPADSFEGYIFPDTYFFNHGMSAESVLRMMVDNFYKRISQISNVQDMTPEQLFYVVRLASIVEREYRVASEAPLIASVFTNRLRRGIGLYSCATVEYIITEIQGKPHPDVITNKDLKIDNPYNTYLWAGLPPGPISCPGLIALNAAANPPRTSYYYFRLTDAQKGTHYFSEDFDEHIDAGKVYTKKAAGK